jgi:hypothetical protein
MWPFNKKSNHFKGIDLDQYHFVGRSVPSYSSDSEVVNEMHLYFFANKDDPKDRRLIKECKSKEDRRKMDFHPFVRDAEVWAIGEGHIYELVLLPSNYLIQYMLDFGRYQYDYSTNSWVSCNKPLQQKPTASKEDNVLHVKFTKD